MKKITETNLLGSSQDLCLIQKERQHSSDKSYCLFTHFTELIFDAIFSSKSAVNTQILFICVLVRTEPCCCEKFGNTQWIWIAMKKNFGNQNFHVYPSVRNNELFLNSRTLDRKKKQISQSDSLASGKNIAASDSRPFQNKHKQ